MSKLFNILIIFALATALTACSDDETLTPSAVDTMSRFEFPEGDSEYDKIFEQIYEEHGVQIIYQNWTEKDWEKAWKDPGLTGVSSSYYGTHPSNGVIDTLSIVAEFVRDDIFKHISPELTRKTLRPYIYLVNGYHTFFSFGTITLQSYSIRNENPGLDNVIWSPYSLNTSYPNFLEGNAQTKHLIRCIYLWCDILEDAMNKGIIADLPSLSAGLDLTTAMYINSSYINDANYYLTRGFVNIVERLFNRSAAPPISGNTIYPAAYNSETGKKTLLQHYIRFAMYYDEETINTTYGQYPLVMERYEMVTDYMLDVYGVDLKAIARR